jgi:hypothetical protein
LSANDPLPVIRSRGPDCPLSAAQRSRRKRECLPAQRPFRCESVHSFCQLGLVSTSSRTRRTSHFTDLLVIEAAPTRLRKQEESDYQRDSCDHNRVPSKKFCKRARSRATALPVTRTEIASVITKEIGVNSHAVLSFAHTLPCAFASAQSASGTGCLDRASRNDRLTDHCNFSNRLRRLKTVLQLLLSRRNLAQDSEQGFEIKRLDKVVIEAGSLGFFLVLRQTIAGDGNQHRVGRLGIVT